MGTSMLAIVQARVGSTRLPGKVLKEIHGKTLIEILFSRLNRSQRIDKAILATSTNKENDTLVSVVENLQIDVFRGSEHDVLGRFFYAAQAYQATDVVRITADCPLIDPGLVDRLIERYLEDHVDYASNNHPPTYPDGLDAEVFSFAALKVAHEQSTTAYDREHVTPYIRRDGQFRIINCPNDIDLSAGRWTVDDPEDFEVINNIVLHFSPSLDFSWQDVQKLTRTHTTYFRPNQNTSRNEGAALGTGQKLWKRAKKIIPGGNMLLSKRPEMFLPDLWPTYFSKAKGCLVWDLDGREYVDMSLMGVGTNILGYGHAEVDAAVLRTVNAGNMSTLNCPEEVYLAERLVELHPWADMVRLARTGGEANAIAVRIARAATGKDTIAVCGYHGWHDWYLAANLRSTGQLAGHLLPGLEPRGVPEHLQDSIVTFGYNKIEELEELLSTNQKIGVIKMEVSRNEAPANNFLSAVRELADKENVVLIFDECTSGFRQTFGGLHKHYGVEPDMAVFGKALGNGYAISAVIGQREIMENAQSTFISSTFWTERIGPSAALQTLDVMQAMKSWEIISDRGKYVKEGWRRLGEKHNLNLRVFGLDAMPAYEIYSADWLAYKTLITQMMLNAGYLATNTIYLCIEHTLKIIDAYLDELDDVFRKIKECEDGSGGPGAYLHGSICHDGFKRLN